MNRRNFRKVDTDLKNTRTTRTVVVGDASNVGFVYQRQHDHHVEHDQHGKDTSLQLHLQGRNLPLTSMHHGHQAQPDKPTSLSLQAKVSTTSEQSLGLPQSVSKMPVSQARVRRREKTDNTKKKSTLNIYNYRPNYTWNRGGRVKELRLRCTSRKYLYIWLKNVFGRIRPSAARLHHKRHLLTQCFRQWHDYWWEVRQEWRLLVRAECHYRYVLWSKVISAWKIYMTIQCEKKRKNAIALQMYSRSVRKTLIKGWLDYVQERRRKRLLKNQADTFAIISCMRIAWKWWRRGLMEAGEHRDMSSLALRFWSYRVQTQHWFLWQDAFFKRQEIITQKRLATRHYDGAVVSKCWRGWIVYWKTRQVKVRNKAYAANIYQSALKLRLLNLWLNRLHARQTLAANQQRMTALSHRFKTRQLFTCWKFYVKLRKETRDSKEMAEQHYRHNRLVLGLTAFRLNLVQHRVQVVRTQMADALRINHLMKWVWTRWDACYEQKEELRMLSKTTCARKHFRFVILKRCVGSWLQYVHWRRIRNVQYIKADAYFYQRTASLCLFKMRVFAQMEKNDRELAQKAVEFRRESLCCQYFQEWKSEWKQSKENRMLYRIAILHSEDVMIARVFSLWKARTSQALTQKEKEAFAVEHFDTWLQQEYLLAWKKYVDQLRRNEVNEIKAARHYCRILLSRAVKRWKQYHVHKRCSNLRFQKAAHFHNRTLYRMTLTHWRKYVCHMQGVSAVVEVKFQEKCQNLLRWSVVRWRENVELQVCMRRQENKGVIFHNTQLVAKVLLSWHRYTAVRAYKRSQTQQLMQSVKQQLSQCKLRHFFDRWHREYLLSVHMNQSLYQANQHFRRALLEKVVYQWQSFTRLRMKKHLIARQSMWFYRVCTTAKFLHLWKLRHAQLQDEHDKTNLALWHWSLVLLQKTVTSWHEFILDKKRKKQREIEVLEKRRIRFLQIGVTKWLTVASDLSDLRAKFAAQRQAKSAFDKFQITQKYALKWRYITRRKQHRNQTLTTKKPAVQENLHLPAGIGLMDPMLLVADKTSLNMANYSNMPHSSNMPHTGRVRTEQTVPVLKTALSPVIAQRAKPRKPDFLKDSLKRLGLHSSLQDMLETRREQPDAIEEMVNIKPTHNKPRSAITDVHSKESANHEINVLLDPRSQNDVTSSEHPRHYDDNITAVSTEHKQTKCDVALPSQNPSLTLKPGSQHVNTSKQKREQDFQLEGCQCSRLPDINPRYPERKESSLVLLTPMDFVNKSENTAVSALRQEIPELSNDRVCDYTSVTETPVLHNISSSTVNTLKSSQHLSPAVELIQIRDTLNTFQTQKKKLRQLQKQQRLLADWLNEDGNEENEESASVREELNSLLKEIDLLKKFVDAQRPACAQLVEKTKELMNKLGASV